MPKATPTPASSRPSLRRNQACLTCRKKKLKCDASRPHCTTCVKHWHAMISVPPPVGHAHPTEPLCTYDPIDGLLASSEGEPGEKIRDLEDEVARLRAQLAEAQSQSQTPSTSAQHSSATATSLAAGMQTLQTAASTSTNGYMGRDRSGAANMTYDSPTSQVASSSGTYDISQASTAPTSPYTDILIAGADPDLPPSDALMRLAETFFKCDPCGSRILHRPSFLSSMRLHPNDPNYPHPAILHAICASASRWVSRDIVTGPDGVRRDNFAELHVSKTRAYIDKTMATGQDIFPVMQACILLSWYFYLEGRWVEVWIFAGFQTRVAVPLRLNFPGTFSFHQSNGPGAFLAPPKDFKELELRRRAWWMTILFDRFVASGGWIHSIAETDIGTELPLRTYDFESLTGCISNPQDLSQEDVFTRHPIDYTDSFTLFLKAVMLFGRVSDFSTKTNLRATAPPSKTLDPFTLPGFAALDQLLCVEFLESFPAAYKHPIMTNDGQTLDTDLYMARILPHAATITLHNMYSDFNDWNKISTQRCFRAARAILQAYSELSQTSWDITRLHPFIVICWYLSAVVHIQICKYYIESGEAGMEASVWEEINVLRFAMLVYGSRSPIGHRQEKVLQGLMTEIVRLSQRAVLPLYPFSRDGTFPDVPLLGGGAPLPNDKCFETTQAQSTTVASVGSCFPSPLRSEWHGQLNNYSLAMAGAQGFMQPGQPYVGMAMDYTV